MKFIKRYLTFHLCAILGYYVFITILLSFNSIQDIKLFFKLIFEGNEGFYVVHFLFSTVIGIYISIIVTVEIFIHLLVKQIFKKDLSININNKFYNIFFYIGLILLFLEILPSLLLIIPIPYITF